MCFHLKRVPLALYFKGALSLLLSCVCVCFNHNHSYFIALLVHLCLFCLFVYLVYLIRNGFMNALQLPTLFPTCVLLWKEGYL